MSNPDLEYLRPFATTKRQEEILTAVMAYGTYRKAAAALGVGYTAIGEKMAAMKKAAAAGGHAPGHFDSGTAPGYMMGKVTIQRGPDGEIRQSWERQHPNDYERQEAFRAALEAIAEDLPRAEPIRAPERTEAALLNTYVMTDCHIGMLAAKEEGGADWNLAEAERVLTGCFIDMVERSPKAKTAIVAQMGDWLHYDSKQPVTPTSRHIVDASGTPRQMMRAGIRILRRLVSAALEMHDAVILLAAEGNHDIWSSAWMQELFAAYYEDEPRVTVICQENPYYAVQHGKVMLGFHHGHLKKPQDMPLLMATQFAEIWGATEYRYAHTGDKHHLQEKELSGMTVIQHQTLIAREAHTSRNGWFSNRATRAITYHAEYGEVSRLATTPEMLEAA